MTSQWTWATCQLTAVFLPEQNLCITGLCSVVRYLISNADPSDRMLLGYQGNCLEAPAEVSTWTKFCEIDLPRATQTFFEQQQQTEVLPFELARFEVHMGQPVKIHNIRKRMQQDSSGMV